MSKIIRSIKPGATVIGNPNSPRTGAFEVVIDGKEVYSRFKKGGFPSDEDVKSWF